VGHSAGTVSAMTSRKAFVDVADMGRKREDAEDHIVISLWGSKGGRLGNAAISIDEARNLRDTLIDAIGKLEYWAGDR
jgi:hypothetical protein